MFVLLWSGKDIDGWDSFKSVEDAQVKAKELINEGFFADDMLFFARHDYSVPEEDGTLHY